MSRSGGRQGVSPRRGRRVAPMAALVLLLAGGAAASDRPVVDAHVLANARYIVDVAATEGDPVADVLLAERLAASFSLPAPATDDAATAEAWGLLQARAQVVTRELEARVAAARDADPLLLALEAHCPGDASRCADARVRLAGLAGDNAAHHLLLAALAWREGDAEGFLRHARDAGAATRYDAGHARIFGALYRRFRAVPRPGPVDAAGPRMHNAAAVEAMAMMAARAAPWFGIVEPCLASEGDLRRSCHQIARQLMQSQILMDVSVAQSLLKALGTPDERALAEARFNRGMWLLMATSQRDPNLVDPRYSEDYRLYFVDFAAYGELAALERLAERFGLPPEPPAGWTMESHAASLRRQHEATATP